MSARHATSATISTRDDVVGLLDGVMSAADVDKILLSFKNSDGTVRYNEFMGWVMRGAASQVVPHWDRQNDRESVMINIEVALGPASQPWDRSSKAAAATQYLSEHRVGPRLTEAVTALLAVKPRDPFEFLTTCFKAVAGNSPKMDKCQEMESQINKLKAQVESLQTQLKKTSSKRPDKVKRVETFEEKQSKPLNKLMEKLGGRQKILEMKDRSERLKMLVDERCPKDCTDHQDMIYQGAGLGKLLDDGEALKPKFDQMCNLVTERFTKTSGLSSEFTTAPIKGISRAEVKVRVGLNGNVTYLRDTVRGTLNITGEPGLDTLERVYDALTDMVVEIGKLPHGMQVAVVRFKDSYIRPKGGYSDWQFLLSVNGYICELQVNFAAALKEKENAQHKEYELERMAKDNLLYAAMRGDATAVRLMLQTGLSFRGVRDMIGCTPLHYAAAYGNKEMVMDLLTANVDPVALDNFGTLPVQRALLAGYNDTAALIVESMSSVKMIETPPALAQSLVCAWDAACSVPSLAAQMREIMIQGADLSDYEHLYYAVLGGKADACNRLLEEQEQVRHAKFFEPFHSQYGFIMDHAIANGEVAVVQALDKHRAKDACSVLIHVDESVVEAYAKRNNASALDAMYLAGSLEGQMGDETLARLLQVAAEHRSFEAVELLLRRGAKLQPGACQALTKELFSAVGSNNLPMVELILDAQIDVNTLQQGEAVMSIAASLGHLDMCKYLLERGANWTYCGAEGTPPLWDAIDENRLSVVKLFHEMNGDFSNFSHEGMTPMQFAAEEKRDHVVALIQSLMDGDD